jgi:hypothetical protein
MAEFVEAIGEAIATARTDLEAARREGDVDLAIVHEGRLEELRRLAAANGVDAA